MSFLENAGGEVIGGIIAGLFAILVGSIWRQFRSFSIKFVNTEQPLKAEKTKQYTAIRFYNPGKYRLGFILRPRQGVEMTGYSFSFHNHGTFPWRVGSRIYTKDIRVTSFRFRKVDGSGEYEEQPIILGMMVMKVVGVESQGLCIFRYGGAAVPEGSEPVFR